MDCPAGPPTPADGESVDGGKRDKKKAGGDGTELVVTGVVEGEGEGGVVEDDMYCSIEQELWTSCSADCLQERYLDEACEKEAEVRSV